MNKQTIDYYRHFLVQIPTPAVEELNESTFINYAKGWAHMGFLPILTKIDEHTYHVKLYLNDSVINDREQLCMFTATYFRERFCQLSTQAKSNQIVVYAQTWLTPKQIASATSLNDLEQSLLSFLPDETLFNCNDRGEGVIHYLSNVPSKFHHWNRLAFEGYFEADYEEKFRLEDEQKRQEESGPKTRSLQLFMKTGGWQPATWDVKFINKYFKGDIAKGWTMVDGYFPTYTGFANGVIQFDLVTDPRCTDLNWNSLCNKIAIQYKQEIDLLTDATNFEVKHFIVNDIIGFNINAAEEEKVNRHDERVQATYASMPEKPSWIHHGRINLMAKLTIALVRQMELELDIKEQTTIQPDIEPTSRSRLILKKNMKRDWYSNIKEQILQDIMENRKVSREEAEIILANPW